MLEQRSTTPKPGRTATVALSSIVHDRPDDADGGVPRLSRLARADLRTELRGIGRVHVVVEVSPSWELSDTEAITVCDLILQRLGSKLGVHPPEPAGPPESRGEVQ